MFNFMVGQKHLLERSASDIFEVRLIAPGRATRL
jgi:hypothetical protein